MLRCFVGDQTILNCIFRRQISEGFLRHAREIFISISQTPLLSIYAHSFQMLFVQIGVWVMIDCPQDSLKRALYAPHGFPNLPDGFFPHGHVHKDSALRTVGQMVCVYMRLKRLSVSENRKVCESVVHKQRKSPVVGLISWTTASHAYSTTNVCPW